MRRIAEDRGLDAETVERLTAEAGERIERDNFAALLDRPFEKIVADICRDLGLDARQAPGAEAPSAATPAEGRPPAAGRAVQSRHEDHDDHEEHEEEHTVLRDLPS